MIFSDDQNMFGFNVKDAKKEKTASIFSFQYSENNNHPLHEVLKLIAKQIAQRDTSKSFEHFILHSLPSSRVCSLPIPPTTQSKVFDKVCNLVNKPSINNINTNYVKPITKHVLRKSLSCGDLCDAL